MDINVDNVENAVNLFYNSDSHEQKQVHQWLNDLQSSPQAWSIVWDILNTPRSTQVHFFAASTLHIKLMRHWNEIPPSEYENFKKNMLRLIIKFATGPKIVLNRLCIAFASFIIHTISSFWKNALEDLVCSFQPQNLPHLDPGRVMWILLEIFNVIPEEFKTTFLSSQTRKDVFNALSSAVRDINKFCLMSIQPTPDAGFSIANTTLYVWAARCIYSWLPNAPMDVEECQHISEVFTDVICFIYWNRSDPECFSSEESELMEICSDVLIVLLQLPNMHKQRGLVIKICIDFLYKCRKLLEVEGQREDFNEDMLLHLYTVISTLADGHVKIFLNNLLSDDKDEQKLTCDLFKSILDCVNLPGVFSVRENISNLAFGALYTIQEEVAGFEGSEYAKLLILIKPLYRDLVYILLRKGEYPLNETNWSEDEQDSFRCYRIDISDTFIYCYNVLNLELLDILYTRLTEILKKKDYQWNELESCLHAVGSVAECTEMENLYLPRLMLTIKDIPFDRLNYRVLNTAITAIGNYSVLISENQEVLNYTLPLVIKALENPEMSFTATLALKNITSCCHKYMLPYAEPILIQIQKVLTMGLLKMPANRRIFSCMGRVLSVLPFSAAMHSLNIILAPYFEELQKELEVDPPSVRISVLTKLKILNALYGSMGSNEENDKNTGPQPLLFIMQNTMQVYKVIGESYCKDLPLMETIDSIYYILNLCNRHGGTPNKCQELILGAFKRLQSKTADGKCTVSIDNLLLMVLPKVYVKISIQQIHEELSGVLKSAITTLLDFSKPIISDVLHIIMTVYKLNPQNPMLNLAKPIFIMFCKDEDINPMIHQTLAGIVNITLEMCSQYQNENSLSEKSDILDGFFSLLSSLLKKLPSYIFFGGSINLVLIFQFALMVLALPEPQVLRACSSFMSVMIVECVDTGNSQIINSVGESLMLRMLLNLGTTTPRQNVAFFADIFQALNKKCRENLHKWLYQFLSQENFPTDKISLKDKEKFVQSVISTSMNKKKMAEILLEFSLTCKGIIINDNLRTFQ